MKWLLLAVGILVLLVLVIVLIGLLLPRGHEASAQATIAARPEAVFGIITDFAGGASWRTGIKEAELLPPRAGKPAFRERGAGGERIYVVEETSPPRRLVTRIVEQSAFGGTWTYELAPEDAGTRVQITERGEVNNPVFRFVSRFFFSPTAMIERYLADLKERTKALSSS